MSLLKRGALFFSIMILVLSLLSGCSGNAGSSGKNDVVTLRMVESITSPARTKLLKEMISKFEEENKNIKVELISPPLQSADQKIAQMLEAKEDIDVLEVRDTTVTQFTNNKYIEDLSKYKNKWKQWDDLTETVKQGATALNNTPYFIPYGVYEQSLFYRKDWFEEAGLEVPKTWDELIAAAKKLTDPSKNRYGYSFRGGAGSSNYTEFMIWSYLGKDVVPDDAYFTQNGDTIFDAPGAKQALNDFLNLYKESSPPDSINWSYPEMVQGFTSGMTAMLIQDPEVITTCKENMEEGTWDTAPLPKGPSGVAQRTAGTAGWGIGAFSKHKEEAWKLISFLSSPEQNLYFAKNNSLIPIHKSAGEDSYFKEGYFSPYIEMDAKTDEYLVANRPVNYKGYTEFKAQAEKDIQSLLLKKSSVNDTLSKWSEFWKNEKEKK